jgi:hypothetical protein
MTERRVTSPTGVFTASPSLQEAHNSSAFSVGRHCGALHEYNGEAPEEARVDLPEILGRRLYYINISVDESSYTYFVGSDNHEPVETKSITCDS